MAVEITHIRMSEGGSTEAHIIRYKWREPNDGKVGDSDKPTMVDWIDNKNGSAYVGSGSDRVQVGVVHPAQGQPYLRTYADEKWTNNLLALPRF